MERIASLPPLAPAVRPAVADDLPRVLEVERACFSTPWGAGSFQSLLGLERVRFLVAEREGQVVGHAILWWAEEEGELANLAVHPSARRQGVATTLLDRTLEGARRHGLRHVFLEVRVSNQAAAHLYRSRGFGEVGIRRGYYRDPLEDARILRVELSAGAFAAGATERNVSDPAIGEREGMR